MIYAPILKGREGEFAAIAELSDDLAPSILPIFEVMPRSEDPVQDAFEFIQRAQKSVPRGMAIAVDVSHLDDPSTGWRTPMRDIAGDLGAWGVPILPVVHLADPGRQLAHAREAAQMHTGHTVIRLDVTASDPGDRQTQARLTSLWRHAGLTVERASLVLDLVEVQDERDARTAEPLVRKWVSRARQYPWKSIIVACGAMPAKLSGLPTNTATALPRHDWALWRRTRELGALFGDYGITHPTMAGRGRNPMPNLRYTASDTWWIYRWPHQRDSGEAMYDLRTSLVASDHWPAQGADYSWGDAQIARCARRLRGPGNPSSWRAWSTAHHLTHVIRTLAVPH